VGKRAERAAAAAAATAAGAHLMSVSTGDKEVADSRLTIKHKTRRPFSPPAPPLEWD